MPRYNVEYDAPNGSQTYLAYDTDMKTALRYKQLFTDKYVGKPYPNGSGYYPFTNPRIVEREQG